MQLERCRQRLRSRLHIRKLSLFFTSIHPLWREYANYKKSLQTKGPLDGAPHFHFKYPCMELDIQSTDSCFYHMVHINKKEKWFAKTFFHNRCKFAQYANFYATFRLTCRSPHCSGYDHVVSCTLLIIDNPPNPCFADSIQLNSIQPRSDVTWS